MSILRSIAKTIPGLPAVYTLLRKQYAFYRLKLKPTEQVFTEIYREKNWGGEVSVSGTGSDAPQTRLLIQELPPLLREFRLSSLLDIPCGDFHWMKDVDLHGINYVGADIVRELIDLNIKRYGKAGVEFRHLNLIKDALPKADLVLCRDCLVHFSFADIRSALRNIRESGSTYLLTTTFTDRTGNSDIPTGKWRPLNLERPPFALPPPLRVIEEGCMERDGAFRDKALALWRVADLDRRR